MHSSHIYNNQKLKSTQMFLNRRMETENVVIYTMEYYSAIKINEFLKFSGLWIKLENIILCEASQSQNNTLAITDKRILAKKLRICKV